MLDPTQDLGLKTPDSIKTPCKAGPSNTLPQERKPLPGDLLADKTGG